MTDNADKPEWKMCHECGEEQTDDNFSYSLQHCDGCYDLVESLKEEE